MQLFSRLQSLWRLSVQLHCLETQKKLSPLPASLHIPFLSTVNSTSTTATVVPPPELFVPTTFPMNPVPGYQIPSTGAFAGGSYGSATLRSFARAEPPALSNFKADPFRFTSEPSTETPHTDDSTSIDFMRTNKDRKGCVYYKLTLDIPNATTPSVALLEISPEYPIRSPQVLLSSRISVLGIDAAKVTSSPQIDNALKALECDINANCLNMLYPASSSSLETPLSIAIAEECLDATLTFQVGLLLCSVATNHASNTGSGLVQSISSKKRGRNRKAAALQSLYGRQQF